MLKTSNWEAFVRDGACVAGTSKSITVDAPLDPETRHRLATAPFPAVRIMTPRSAAHALGYKRPSMDGASDQGRF